MIDLQSGAVTHLDAAGQLQMMIIEPGMAPLSQDEARELADLIESIDQLHGDTAATASVIDVPAQKIADEPAPVPVPKPKRDPVRLPHSLSLAAMLAAPVTALKDRKIAPRPQHSKPGTGLHTGALDRIASALSDAAQSIAELSDASGVPARSLSTMMHRLLADGRAVKVSRGLYRRGEA